jgi:hypothetical protein
MSKVRKADGDKTLNGKKMSKVRNVESEDIMVKIVKNVESKEMYLNYYFLKNY